MPIIHAIVLGLTQGFSEFLPISSSGHLVLVPWLFGWDDFKGNASVEKAFDVALHLGTLVGVVVYFWSDLCVFARDGLRMVFKRSEPATAEGRLAWLLLVSAIPAGLAGAVGESFIEDHLGQIPLIAVMLIVFGLVLLWADRRVGARAPETFSHRDAWIMGAVQALALEPGVSRSGATMTAARAVGFSRDAAARLSFLMSVPIIAGAVVYKLAKQLRDGIPGDLKGAMVAGVLTSAVSGFVAIWGTLRIVRTRSFAPFVAYRVALGVVVLVVALSGAR